MKLRNGKTYLKKFNWEKAIYLSQLRASQALVIPIRVGEEIIEDGICGNSYLVIRPKAASREIIREGITKGYLFYENGKIISKIFLKTQSFSRNQTFMNSLEMELKNAGVNCHSISYID